MCRRITGGPCPPEFLVLPNYEDYQGRPGDVGFVTKVTHLQETRPGASAFSIHGVCSHMVLVQATWSEPQTQGLSWGKCIPLPSQFKRQHMTFDELQTSLTNLNNSPEWNQQDQSHETGEAKVYSYSGHDDARKEMFFIVSANMARADLAWIFICGGSDEEAAKVISSYQLFHRLPYDWPAHAQKEGLAASATLSHESRCIVANACVRFDCLAVACV